MLRNVAFILAASAALIACKDDKNRDTGEREGTDKWLGGKKPQPSDDPSPPGWMRDQPANTPAGHSRGAGVPVDQPSQVAEKTLRRAHAKLDPLGSAKLGAKAELEEMADGVRIELEMGGAPSGKKGAHIQIQRDCKNPAVGKHFSPEGNAHGLPDDQTRHLGDLGNIEIDSTGEGKLKLKLPHATLKPGDARSLLDRAIVVDASEDRGAAKDGARPQALACGVIRGD